MKASIVRLSDLGHSELAKWRQLQGEMPELANPFLCPEFALAVGRVNPHGRCAVLEDGPSIVGFFPYQLRRDGIAEAIGKGLSDCQGMIYAAGLDWDARWLVRECGIAVWEFDRLLVSQAPFASAHRTTWRSLDIDLTGGYEQYVEERGESHPRLVRDTFRKLRRLEREIGETRFEWQPGSSTLAPRIIAWKSEQYRRTGLDDRFARRGLSELVEELMQTTGAGFSGVVAMLFAGDHPIAGNLMLRYRSVLCGWFPAYDLQFAQYSPGMIHRLKTLEAAATSGVSRFELGREGQPHKDRFSNSEHLLAEGAVELRSVRALVRRAQREPLRAVRSYVVKHPAAYRVARSSVTAFAGVRSKLERRQAP